VDGSGCLLPGLCGAVWVFVAPQNNAILLILDWKSTLNLGFFFAGRLAFIKIVTEHIVK
jgi:hypothetical protein